MNEQESQFLIPKVSASKQKNKVTKNFSIIDLIFMIIFLGVAIVLALVVNPIAIKIPLIVIVVLVLFFLLLHYEGKAGYSWIKIFVQYLRSVKKISNTENVLKDDAFFNRYFKTNKKFIVPIKITGYNFSLMPVERQRMVINGSNLAFSMIKGASYSIYKVNQVDSRKKTHLFWEKIASSSKDTNIKTVATEYASHYKNNAVAVNYFIFLYFDSQSKMDHDRRAIYQALKTAGMKPTFLSAKGIKRLLNNITHPIVSPKTTIVKEINIKKDHLLLNANSYVRYITLEGFASESQYAAFLQPLFQKTEGNVCINVKELAKNVAIENINKAIRRTKDIAGTNKKSSENIYTQSHLEQLTALQEQIILGQDKYLQVNIVVSLIGSSLKEIKTKEKNFLTEWTGYFSLIRKGAFQQLGLYKSYLPFGVGRSIKESCIDMPLSSLAGGYPFDSTGHNDEKGIYLGYDNLSNDLKLDIWEKDEYRVNSNIVLFGKSGNGKSFFAKKVLLNQLCMNTQVFIIDPEGEYTKMCQALNGVHLDLGAGVSNDKGNCINPLQVFVTDETYNNNQLINNQVDFVVNFLSILLSNLTEIELLILRQSLKNFYVTNYGDKDIVKLAPNEFKTFSDFYAFVEKSTMTTDEFNKEQAKSILMSLKQFTEGSYNHLWNHPTSIDLNKNKFYCLDVNSLLGIGSANAKLNAQMYLSLNYLTTQMIANRRSNLVNPNAKKQIIIAVDEAHLLVDSKNPVALDFIATTMKRIRKYDGSLLVITQNVNDFMGDISIKKQAQAIVNNAQYSFIFNLNPSDLNDLNDLYKSSGGLTSEVRSFVATAIRGECLSILDHQEQLITTIKATHSEASLIT